MKDRYARLAADALQRMSGMTDHALDFAGTGSCGVEILVRYWRECRECWILWGQTLLAMMKIFSEQVAVLRDMVVWRR